MNQFRLWLTEPFGQILKFTPEFRGKSKLVEYWIKKIKKCAVYTRTLPGGENILCDLSIPYESMVWLAREEQFELELLTRLLKPGQTFIDCGANIGLWTLVAASTVGQTGQIYAFEPNPSTFIKLTKNVALSSASKNIKLFELAVGKYNLKVNFICCEEHNVSRISNMPGQSSTVVSLVTLDSTLKDQHIDGLKIDVENFELEALQGAENILKNNRPWIIVEFNTLLAGNNKIRNWPVHQYLVSLGYVCRQVKDALDTNDEHILSDDWKTNGYCNLYYSSKS